MTFLHKQVVVTILLLAAGSFQSVRPDNPPQQEPAATVQVSFEGLEIDSVVVENRNIYDTEDEAYDRFIFKAAYDFADGDTEFKDLYVGVKDLPLDSTLRVGYFREPFSLESLTKEYGLRLGERSLSYILAPGRNTGAALNGAVLDRRVTWGVGVFYNTNSFGEGGGDGDVSATARTTWLPWSRQPLPTSTWPVPDVPTVRCHCVVHATSTVCGAFMVTASPTVGAM